MKNWTEKDDNFLRKNYANMTALQMSVVFGVTRSAIKNRVNKLGIRLPGIIKEERYKRGQFIEGHNSFNKGKKQITYMSKKSIEATKKTRFKKGGLPHNTRSNFEISLRTDKRKVTEQFIRVGLANWIPLRRHIWEQAHGKIPQGMIVRYKDGNVNNCVLENLECITKADNMKLNTIHRYPPELKQVMRLTGKLKRTINKKQNG